jgi:hypothetical protein
MKLERPADSSDGLYTLAAMLHISNIYVWDTVALLWSNNYSTNTYKYLFKSW